MTKILLEKEFKNIYKKILRKLLGLKNKAQLQKN